MYTMKEEITSNIASGITSTTKVLVLEYCAVVQQQDSLVIMKGKEAREMAQQVKGLAA